MKAYHHYTCKELNDLDLVDFLEKLGHRPDKIRRQDYWYLSPLRDERTPSFKVNRAFNIWYDHGLGKGGRLVDFGIEYFRCSISEFIAKMNSEPCDNFLFQQHQHSDRKDSISSSEKDSKITILNSTTITDSTLAGYLNQRNIPLSLASRYCEQVSFELHCRKHLAIGFKNDLGGYELRNQYFKGSSSPKAPRLIAITGSEELTVFEGFFNFLSFQTIQKCTFEKARRLPKIQTNFLVLNSLSFFEKSRERMEQYGRVHLFLDRDQMGIKSTQRALEWSSKYIDQSTYYKNCKDLNDYLVKCLNQELRQRPGKGMKI